MKILKQVGAIPYVETEGSLLVLLITTRGRGHWTVPKGWPNPGITAPQLAAQETFEEAGVTGEVGTRPVGSYLYTKRLHLFSWVRCSVELYPLHANCQHLHWPEKPSRKSIWLEPREAAKKVKEPQLASVLREFGLSATAFLDGR